MISPNMQFACKLILYIQHGHINLFAWFNGEKTVKSYKPLLTSSIGDFDLQ